MRVEGGKRKLALVEVTLGARPALSPQGPSTTSRELFRPADGSRDRALGPPRHRGGDAGAIYREGAEISCCRASLWDRLTECSTHSPDGLQPFRPFASTEEIAPRLLRTIN